MLDCVAVELVGEIDLVVLVMELSEGRRPRRLGELVRGYHDHAHAHAHARHVLELDCIDADGVVEAVLNVVLEVVDHWKHVRPVL